MSRKLMGRVLAVAGLTVFLLNGDVRAQGRSSATWAGPSGRIVQGRVAGIDVVRRDIIVRGMLTGVPNVPAAPRTGVGTATDRARIAPEAGPLPVDPALQRDPFDPDAPFRNRADVTGTGRTGQA